MKRLLVFVFAVVLLGSCSKNTGGCTDANAENYNADASADDGSCEYPDNGNYSLSFDGDGDWVSLNQNKPISGIDNTFSIAAKFNLLSSSNRVNLYSGIYHHRADYDDISLRVLHNNDGEFLEYHIAHYNVITFPIKLGNWYDVVGPYARE